MAACGFTEALTFALVSTIEIKVANKFFEEKRSDFVKHLEQCDNIYIIFFFIFSPSILFYNAMNRIQNNDIILSVFVQCSREDIADKLCKKIEDLPAVHIANPKTMEFQV